MSSVSIPNRPAFRAQEVCEIANVQSYVLRGWEAEFPDLGAAKTPNGQRVYGRADVERVLRLKHLIQVEGLTLSGARRRLEEEAEPDVFSGEPDASTGAVASSPLDDEARAHLREARQGLEWILKTLNGSGAGEFTLAAVPQAAPRSGKTRKKKVVGGM